MIQTLVLVTWVHFSATTVREKDLKIRKEHRYILLQLVCSGHSMLAWVRQCVRHGRAECGELRCRTAGVLDGHGAGRLPRLPSVIFSSTEQQQGFLIVPRRVPLKPKCTPLTFRTHGSHRKENIKTDPVTCFIHTTLLRVTFTSGML